MPKIMLVKNTTFFHKNKSRTVLKEGTILQTIVPTGVPRPSAYLWVEVKGEEFLLTKDEYEIVKE